MAGSILDLAPCFQYTNPANGDLVIKASSDDYVKSIGIKVCSLSIQTNSQFNLLSELANKVLVLENKPIPTFTLPSLIPTTIASNQIPLVITEFLAILELQFGQLRNATGNPQQIYVNITKVPNNINSSKALGTSGSNLSSLPGWNSTMINLADAVGNIFIMLTDLRSAFRNMELAIGSSCEAVAVVLQGTLQVKFLKLYFTGTIPTNLISCVNEGASFKIQDNSGNFVNYNINVKDNLNVSSGLGIDLSGTPLNFADDLKISGIMSLCDPDSGTQCQKYIEETISNITTCPTLNLSSNYTSISYNFVHVDGTLTYSIQLFNQNNVMVQSRNVNVSSATVVSGTFNDLAVATSFKVRLQIITSNSTKTCPFTQINTLDNPCPAPNSVEAVIELE